MDITQKIQNAYKRLEEYEGLIGGRLKAALLLGTKEEKARSKRERDNLIIRAACIREFLAEKGQAIPGYI